MKSAGCWFAGLALLLGGTSGCGVKRDAGASGPPQADSGAEAASADSFASAAGDLLVQTADVQDGTARGGNASSAPGPRKRLRYHFEEGKSYSYQTKIEAELGDKILVTQAACTYSVHKPGAPATPQEPITGTGTAFVVHADGYLLTCAHVVQDANQVEVALAGKTYAGRVLNVDDSLDLALIKIEARSLPVLPLGDSQRVQVGEEVRAVGYPLSDLLGSSLKATRGSVSGIDQIDGHQTFHIDASVNGGNSGGPLVSRSGQVVGVVNAKLAGHAISNVGFAVPIDYAKRLLGGQRVQFAKGTATAALDGPALVKKVEPSIALVTVTLSKLPGESFTLHASGTISRSERTKRFVPGRGPSFPTTVRYGGRPPVELKVDAHGGIHEFNGTESLPLLLGYAPLLIFEPLPADGRDTWKTRTEITLESRTKSEQDESPFGFGRSRFGPRGPIGRGRSGPIGPRFGPGARQQPPAQTEVKEYPAIEEVTYRLEPGSGSTTIIHKEYELKTEGADENSPGLQMTGSGQIMFDTEAGLPRKMDYKGAFTISSGAVSVNVPFTMTYELRDEAPAQTAAAQPAQPAPSSQASTPPAQPPASASQPRPVRPTRPSRAAAITPDAEFVAVGAEPSRLAVRSSKSYRDATPDRAFDGDPKSVWAAGGWPVHWIEADLRQPTTLGRIKLHVDQSPASETEHEIWISQQPLGAERPDGTLIHTFNGMTKKDDVLEFQFPAGTTARYVQVRTTKSRSWVAWSEIEIQPAGK
jgi:S1-C subfamily serine protease